MKYKVVGIIDCLIGALLFFQAGTFLFIVLPKLTHLYNQMTVPPQNLSSYLLAGLMLIMGIAGLGLGFTQFTQNKEKYFKKALVTLIIISASVGFYSSLLIASTLQSIYNLTTSF